MRQNYKVFLSETEIVFTLNSLSDAPNEIELSKHDIINLLERNLPSTKIVITSADPSAAFEKFCSFFLRIDAAGGVVRSAENGKFLLIFRNGVWDFPKGKMDEGETPETTAVREVEEECGIDGLTNTHKAGTTYHGYIFKGQPCLKTTYWYLMECHSKVEPKGQADEGITEVRWVAVAEVEKLLEKSFGSIRELWKDFTKSFQDIP
jgi:8-oxo-dGTP pyrophosphatase MutT (NUDIX family)